MTEPRTNSRHTGFSTKRMATSLNQVIEEEDDGYRSYYACNFTIKADSMLAIKCQKQEDATGDGGSRPGGEGEVDGGEGGVVAPAGRRCQRPSFGAHGLRFVIERTRSRGSTDTTC